MRATGVPTGTVSPAGTRISSSTPSYGLGISESTLSVDTSNSGSSNAIVSPTCLSQLPTVPSVTVSPSLGMVMSCTSPPSPRNRAAGDPGTAAPGAAVAGAASEPPVAGAAGSEGAGPLAPGVDPGSPIRTSGVPTGTVSPAGTRISRITPSYGLGISESTLSVDTSNSGSSNATVSPTCLSQLPTMPSVTVSPSLGMVTVHCSTHDRSPASSLSRAGNGRRK